MLCTLLHDLPVPTLSAHSAASASVSTPRRLASSDLPAILNHLLRLSDSDWQIRLCRVANDDGVRSYAARINFERDICIGLFDRQENLVALVQGFTCEADGLRFMEAAFITDETTRRRGLGTLPFAEITDCALAVGVDRVLARLA